MTERSNHRKRNAEAMSTRHLDSEYRDQEINMNVKAMTTRHMDSIQNTGASCRNKMERQ
jgi:hypothetical protein